MTDTTPEVGVFELGAVFQVVAADALVPGRIRRPHGRPVYMSQRRTVAAFALDTKSPRSAGDRGESSRQSVSGRVALLTGWVHLHVLLDECGPGGGVLGLLPHGTIFLVATDARRRGRQTVILGQLA